MHFHPRQSTLFNNKIGLQCFDFQQMVQNIFKSLKQGNSNVNIQGMSRKKLFPQILMSV